jgi:hypothetical protein
MSVIRASLKTQLIKLGKAFAIFFADKVQGKLALKSINSFKIFAHKLYSIAAQLLRQAAKHGQ